MEHTIYAIDAACTSASQLTANRPRLQTLRTAQFRHTPRHHVSAFLVSDDASAATH